MSTSLLLTFAQPDPEHAETFQSYVAASTELAIAAGGEVSSRFQVRPVLGDTPAAIFGLATFPSVDAIDEMFASKAYRALIPAREAGLRAVNAYAIEDAPLSELPDLDGDRVYLVTVAVPDPNGADALAAYQQAAGPLAAKHGGRPVAQLPVATHPVGDTPAAFVAVAEFPSATAVEAFFGDDDYAAVTEVRDRAFRVLNVYVTT